MVISELINAHQFCSYSAAILGEMYNVRKILICVTTGLLKRSPLRRYDAVTMY